MTKTPAPDFTSYGSLGWVIDRKRRNIKGALQRDRVSEKEDRLPNRGGDYPRGLGDHSLRRDSCQLCKSWVKTKSSLIDSCNFQNPKPVGGRLPRLLSPFARSHKEILWPFRQYPRLG